MTTPEITQADRKCRTCRWWDAHCWPDPEAGDCRRIDSTGTPHRFSRIRMADGLIAMLDSFGIEETGPGYMCGGWEQ